MVGSLAMLFSRENLLLQKHILAQDQFKCFLHLCHHGSECTCLKDTIFHKYLLGRGKDLFFSFFRHSYCGLYGVTVFFICIKLFQFHWKGFVMKL